MSFQHKQLGMARGWTIAPCQRRSMSTNSSTVCNTMQYLTIFVLTVQIGIPLFISLLNMPQCFLFNTAYFMRFIFEEWWKLTPKWNLGMIWTGWALMNLFPHHRGCSPLSMLKLYGAIYVTLGTVYYCIKGALQFHNNVHLEAECLRCGELQFHLSMASIFLLLIYLNLTLMRANRRGRVMWAICLSLPSALLVWYR